MSIDGPTDAVFGPDGNLYVTSFSLGDIRFYDGADGTPLGVFATTSPAVSGPTHLLFRPALSVGRIRRPFG